MAALATLIRDLDREMTSAHSGNMQSVPHVYNTAICDYPMLEV